MVFKNEQSTFQLKITAEYKHWRHIHKFRQVSVWNLKIHDRQSNKPVFFSLEFVNIFTSDGG